MGSDSAPPDDERLYALLQQEAWGAALRWLHRVWRRLDGDARARRAAAVFDEAFFADLEARPVEALERRLMLHHGQMRALPEAKQARLTQTLARRKEAAGDAAAVRTLTRLAPEAGAPETERRTAVQREEARLEGAGVALTRIRSAGRRPDARSSLFKSGQERIFFDALRTVFPTHLVYPNAALSATLDFEQLKDTLSKSERRYFFRALVDAVVVDPLGDLRPVYFFELDSAHHDTPERQQKDRLKDGILAKAGQDLFRLRRTRAEAGAGALAKAIRAAVAQPPDEESFGSAPS